MAYVQLNPGLFWPPLLSYPRAGTLNNSSAMTASTHKIAFSGQVFIPGRGSKSISRVQFRFGTITKAGGSGLTVSLQDVSTASGPPAQPDGTQDQTVAIANGDASFASDTWYRTGAFSANRAVTHGDWLSVVVEYDGSGRLGADSITLTVYISDNVMGFQGNARSDAIYSADVGSGWSTPTTLIPNLVLEFSDGTFGSLGSNAAVSAVGTASFKSDTGTSDEYALRFQVPFDCKVDGVWFGGQVAANTSDFDMVLYDGSGALSGGSVSVDANRIRAAAANNAFCYSLASEVSLTADTTYYLSVKPTQATSTVTLNYFDVNANGHLVLAGGIQNYLATRLDGGAWDESVTTRRPMIAVRISSISTGSGGGSSGNVIDL